MPISDDELFCDPTFVASSEVTESNENLLDGVCVDDRS